ncbi:50S ribosomal protein L24 [Candidatus Dependentiae bacterium]|nr:50S ribosomal protein L24 [Candidatus Dependentiae bacterium]
MVARIKKNDIVMVVSGKYRGKTGPVISISRKKNKVLIKDVAMVAKHMKARKQGDVAGIKHKESYIALSNVMPVCPSSNKPCRVGSKVTDNGKRARMSRRSQEIF